MNFPEGIIVWGDTRFRGKCPLEAVEQVSWFNRIRREYPDTYGAIATHIRNEGMMEGAHLASKVKHRAEGLVVGAADIILPARVPLVIEMKRCDHQKSTVSDEQVRYLLAAQAMGAYACIALGAVAAWEAFEWWRNEYGVDTDNLAG